MQNESFNKRFVNGMHAKEVKWQERFFTTPNNGVAAERWQNGCIVERSCFSIHTSELIYGIESALEP